MRYEWIISGGDVNGTVHVKDLDEIDSFKRWMLIGKNAQKRIGTIIWRAAPQ